MEIFTLKALIEIGILYLVIYAILKRAKGSRFGQALMGVGILVLILALFTYLFNFYVLSRLIQILLIYFSISTVVIFQPEIRRFLATIGALGNITSNPQKGDNLDANLFYKIIQELSTQKMGALFAFEQGISLRGYEESGTRLDAIISSDLIITLFTPPLPLHDGGSIIRNGRLSSAHCLFPVSHNPALTRKGMRHRAAVGLSEETDAIVVVVSEETGNISIAHNGKIITSENNSNSKEIMHWIKKALPENSSGSHFFSKQINSLKKLLAKVLKGFKL